MYERVKHSRSLNRAREGLHIAEHELKLLVSGAVPLGDYGKYAQEQAEERVNAAWNELERLSGL